MIDPQTSELNLTPVAKSIDIIFVPQGAEYQAVCRGLKAKLPRKPQVIPIPIGCSSLSAYLQQWKQSTDYLNQPPRSALLMGLCGGLSSQYGVGEIVIYSGCGYPDKFNQLSWKECDHQLVTLLQHQLKDKTPVVKGLTSDRLIWLGEEKRKLYQQYQMDVVDMEGFSGLKNLTEAGLKVAMIRVISDESKQDLPNITSAISSDGSLKPFPLALSMLQNPIAAIRLIQASLKGLGVLQQLTRQLFCQSINEPN